jgi:hypothetical protein
MAYEYLNAVILNCDSDNIDNMKHIRSRNLPDP